MCYGLVETRRRMLLMIPWIELDRASLPLGGELRLMRRGHEFSIKLGVAELMTSRLNASEAALATLAAEKLKDRPKPRVLIGGLGMGFTLRAALGGVRRGGAGRRRRIGSRRRPLGAGPLGGTVRRLSRRPESSNWLRPMSPR